MGGLIPWGKKEEKKTTEVAVSGDQPEQPRDITIHRGNPLMGRTGGSVVQVRSREVKIAGRKVRVDPYDLIRAIRRVTQTIGEYKDRDDIYSAVIVGALRKARGDLVGILENDFHIHWQIADGESVFYM